MDLRSMLQQSNVILAEAQQQKATSIIRSLGLNPNALSDTDTAIVLGVASSVRELSGRPDPITASVNRIEAEANSHCLCPICRAKMNPVMIHGGREALYCVEHHIALPIEARG